MKTCTRCKKEKELVEFYRNRTKKDGRECACSDCLISYHRDRNKKIKEGGIVKGSNVSEFTIQHKELLEFILTIQTRIEKAHNYVDFVDVGDIIEAYQQSSGKIHFSVGMKSGEEIFSMYHYIVEYYIENKDIVTEGADFGKKCNQCGHNKRLFSFKGKVNCVECNEKKKKYRK